MARTGCKQMLTSSCSCSANQTQLPPDYIDLEKRVDALKLVHQKMLAVT